MAEETIIKPNAVDAAKQAKEKEERAQRLLGTSSDLIDDGKISELFIDKAVRSVTPATSIDASDDAKAITQALLAINDQLVLVNRALSVLIQNQVVQMQIQQRQSGGLVMPRGPLQV